MAQYTVRIPRLVNLAFDIPVHADTLEEAVDKAEPQYEALLEQGVYTLEEFVQLLKQFSGAGEVEVFEVDPECSSIDGKEAFPSWWTQ